MALDLTAAAADIAKELRKVKTDAQALRLEIARLEEREALAENREIIYEAEVDRLNQQVHTLTTIDIPMANDACLEAEGKIEIDEARRKRMMKIAERDALKKLEDSTRELEAKYCNQMLDLQHKIKVRQASLVEREERAAALENGSAEAESQIVIVSGNISQWSIESLATEEKQAPATVFVDLKLTVVSTFYIVL